MNHEGWGQGFSEVAAGGLERLSVDVCTKKAKVGVTANGQKFYYCPCGYKEFA